MVLLACTACSKDQAAEADPCLDTAQRDSLANAVCYEIYAPVCGCDGVTYPNDCYAERSGVRTYKAGTCE